MGRIGGKIQRSTPVWWAYAPTAAHELKETHMSEQERADLAKDDDGTDQDTPDVEAHRMENAGRAEASRFDAGTEPEDRHRNDLGT